MNEPQLFIVSTPIGNLKDITFRAIETLQKVDFILCEDTRVTGILLNHYEIRKELISFNAQSENHKIPHVLDRLSQGHTCALVSDAGTPLLSDPGARLISESIAQGLNVQAIPGPSAMLTALCMSGLPTDSFIFEGFIPQKKGRQKKLSELAAEERTVILYESTYRIEKLLNELCTYMPERHIVVARELTKKFEEVWRGKPAELIADLPSKTIKGEFVVIIAPAYYTSK